MCALLMLLTLSNGMSCMSSHDGNGEFTMTRNRAAEPNFQLNAFKGD